MKKNLKQLVMVLILAIMIFPASVRAEGNNCFGDDLKGADQEAFSTLIDEIQCIKEAHPEFNDERILEIIDQNHTKFERGISDIWNSLTDSEKKLCIRYPFAALKVNTAKNIATSKTESKFGMNGLGDRSDAFRHGIWNAEMTILIGKEKAELFATAHEDKDVTGNESDGYPKAAHRDMDLHNNAVGREIGEDNNKATEEEMADSKYIKGALELVNLPYRDKKLFSQYSLGMKQRLAIALAIMHNPELLILDEPINGLDPIGIAEVRSFIKELCDERGKTILISSHILSEISLLADDVGIIDHGKLLEEESLEELEAKNTKFIHFLVSDARQAAQIILTEFNNKNMQVVDGNNLYLYDTTLPTDVINRLLFERGINIYQVHLCEDTLEDYFKKITGGEGIA